MAATHATDPQRPFAHDPADDCETPLEAYRHIAPFLHKLAIKLHKQKHELRVYDPYFCKGTVVRHLTKCGFPKVHNRNEDFYECIEAGTTPEFDVLVTNPPYGADHIKRLLRFCQASGKPHLLLLPEYVHRKEYYRAATSPATSPPGSALFLWPHARYVYPCTTGGRLANLNVCRHWERDGKCAYGSRCSYLHPTEGGSRCVYLHPTEGGRASREGPGASGASEAERRGLPLGPLGEDRRTHKRKMRPQSVEASEGAADREGGTSGTKARRIVGGQTGGRDLDRSQESDTRASLQAGEDMGQNGDPKPMSANRSATLQTPPSQYWSLWHINLAGCGLEGPKVLQWWSHKYKSKADCSVSQSPPAPLK